MAPGRRYVLRRASVCVLCHALALTGARAFAPCHAPAGAACAFAHSVRRPAARARQIRIRAGPDDTEDADVFGGDFPSYNNYGVGNAADGAPSLAKPAKFSSREPGRRAAGVGDPPLTEFDLTEQLKERVFYVMLDAFDNYPPQEVGRMLDLLWAAGPDAGPTKTSLRQLVQLTAEVEGIAESSRIRSGIPGAQFEDLLDALQVARSRVRMNAKDADMYDPQTPMGFLRQLETDSQVGV